MTSAPYALLEALLDVTPSRFVERPCEAHGVHDDSGTCALEASVRPAREALSAVTS